MRTTPGEFLTPAPARTTAHNGLPNSELAPTTLRSPANTSLGESDANCTGLPENRPQNKRSELSRVEDLSRSRARAGARPLGRNCEHSCVAVWLGSRGGTCVETNWEDTHAGSPIG